MSTWNRIEYAAAAFLVAAAVLVYDLGTGTAEIPRYAGIYCLIGIGLVYTFYLPVVPLSGARLAALCFFAWAALSLLWSPDQRQGGIDLSHVFAALGIVLVAPVIPVRAVPLALTLASAGVLGLLYFAPYGGFGNPNFVAEFLLMALPFVVCFAIGGGYFNPLLGIGTAVLVLGYLLWLNPSHMEFPVFGAAFLLGIGYLVKRKQWAWASISGLSLMCMALFIGWGSVLTSFVHRLEVWTNTLVLISEKPFLGYGLGSFNYEYPRVQEAHLQWFDIGTQLHPITTYMGAAHNEYLQVWMELGVVGLAIVGAIVWLVVSKLSSEDRTSLKIAAVGSLGVTAVLCFLGFPLQNPATLLVASLSLGVLA